MRYRLVHLYPTQCAFARTPPAHRHGSRQTLLALPRGSPRLSFVLALFPFSSLVLVILYASQRARAPKHTAMFHCRCCDCSASRDCGGGAFVPYASRDCDGGAFVPCASRDCGSDAFPSWDFPSCDVSSRDFSSRAFSFWDFSSRDFPSRDFHRHLKFPTHGEPNHSASLLLNSSSHFPRLRFRA